MRPLTKTGNYISTRIGRAIADYKLIEDRDRILVGVSGGKDSLTLLHLLNERRKWAPVKYELIAMHVSTDYDCGRSDRRKLKKFFEDRGIKYRFEKIKIRDKRQARSCFWCSWNRRKALFLATKKFRCNKVALGHHKDDIIETLLLNIFYQGEFSAMNPRQELFGGKVVIIRPLCHVEEPEIGKFAGEMRFPAVQEGCSSAESSKRRLMKKMIKRVGKDCGYIKTNIFRSMSRISREYLQV
ncbi:MAG: tRNA 2-thiocytidine(32) synthetase TtcA [Candidatus Omnitrophica bacterium]|nr:tRNA 2-thiocytidine(32) synthetase TtcA [Candidatus Omnitrophota bacterium]